MHRERAHARLLAQRVQVHGEQHVGGLGLPVGQPLVVPPLELHVVPADPGELVAVGGDRHHARPAPRQRRPEPVDQGEVAEVVDGELGLPAGADPPLGAGHDAGVGDQQVQVAPGGEKTLREAPHAVEVGQVQLGDLDPGDAGGVGAGGIPELADLDAGEAGQGLDRRLGTPGRDDHARARLHQRPDGLQSEARVAARDEGQPP